MDTSSENLVKKPLASASMKKQSSVASAESVRSSLKDVKSGVAPGARVPGAVHSSRRASESTDISDTASSRTRSSTKPAVPTLAELKRRNSTGGLSGKRVDGEASLAEKRVSSSTSGPIKKPLSESRRAMLHSVSPKTPNPVSRLESKRVTSVSLSSPGSGASKKESVKKPVLRSSSSVGVHSSSSNSNGRSGSMRRATSSISSPLARSSSGQSPSVSSGSKLGSSMDKSSSLSSRRKTSTPESRDSRLMMLPQVDVKAGDDLRLDLRGHRVRSLNSKGLNLSPNLEFVYLRDNLLSSLEGIEILKRVKVLDLSFNDFKGPGFEPLVNCKGLQQLYLAGNQITSLSSLPELPNLEFLSVAQNKLKSLSMASQPRLQVLAASKNKISTLKGFPYLPLLEHLRVEENPILEMAHLEAASILLAGPTLKKFNDRDLSHEEQETAKKYPAHTAMCIRDGWEFCRPEHAAESTFLFLMERWKDNVPPGYILKEASVDQPFEDDACHCHFVFVNERMSSTDPELIIKYQWFVGEKSLYNFVPISGAVEEVYWPKKEDVGKLMKVECTPIVGETEYTPIFALSSPVSAGTGCPKVLTLCVQGDLVEGNVIKGSAGVAWCGGTPGKGVASWLRRKWNSSPVVIVGAEDEEYRITVDDIDCSLVFMYTPVTEEGNKGEPQYAMTDFVKAAAPSVTNVEIRGDPVEGNTIKGVGQYFGGREGPSTFEWLRENKENGGFVLVSNGTSEYTLTKEDVGYRLAFVYMPINFEGQEGKSASILTDIVKKAPPKVANLKIVGDLREGSKLTVSAVVTGGNEGSSRVQWFKTYSSTINGENGLEAVSASKITKAFRVPLSAVGYYIVAKFTPMAPDGESGEPAYTISHREVETLPPSLNFLSVTGDFSEGEMLTASYGYIGGHEGTSLYNWYLHENETDRGSLIPDAAGLLQYRITKAAIGKFISFVCTPVRDDGAVGEARIFFGQERVHPGSPRLISLHIVGKGIEGTSLHVDKKYWGGEEGSSVFRWFLTSSDGTQNEIKGSTTSSYTISSDDIGKLISVSCEPVRSDWARGPTVVSEKIGPILPGPPTCHNIELLGSLMEGKHLSFVAAYTGGEKGACTYEWFRVRSNGTKDKLNDNEFLDLTLEDVGKCIELVYTPIRKDGLRGTPKNMVSDVIVPADPVGLQLVIPDCSEDTEVVPHKSYYGGKEGTGEYIWYRTTRMLEGDELINISASPETAVAVGKNLTYTPSLEDVGCYLVLYWVPTCADGKVGEPLVAISSHPVIPALPVVSNVCIKELSADIYVGEGTYYGGHEGSSLCSWYRQDDEGSIVLINGSNSATHEVTDSDYNCRLLFGYTPVRSDSVVGELKLSEPTDVILPELPKIEMLSLNGKATEGEILTAVQIIPNNSVQENVWNKYKKEIRYQWYYSSGMGEEHTFEMLPSQSSCSYKVRSEDIGRCLRCECIITDVFGRCTDPISTTTAPIIPGFPKIDKLEIEGRGYHTNLYAVRGIYSGGKEGKSKIQWLRAMVGSPDLISISGETGRMYEANVDDVGYRLVAVYTPIREDGVEGQAVSASTEPIAVEPDIYKEVKQKLDLGSVKFEVLFDKDRSLKKDSSMVSPERRILEVNRKRVKVVKPGSKTSFPATEIRGTYAPPFHVELFRNDKHRFKIVVDGESEVDLMVQTRHMRDVVVLVIRGFAQKFNSTSLNSLLKIET